MTVKNQFGHLTLEAIMFALVLGALSMIWPTILAIFFGVLLLLQWFSAELEIAVLSWAEIDNVPLVVFSVRSSALPLIFS
ncbi:MAG: hypothetical protein OEU68_19075 [Nitrospira sp.]|jgi:hypothetical protein|nr:hypothetical protein [Nitrospira sp.]MDH4246179.1 hypothetical protein [Nitrospira sp.]MDH5320789.1 hypothetical protein [Nitrospira sp.]